MLTGWSPADVDQQRGQRENGWQGVGNYKVLPHTGCPVKLFLLGYLLFCRLLLMQIAKVGTFLKNSRNLLQDRHKNFEN